MISINAHFSGFLGTEEDSHIHPADWTLSVVAVEKKKNKKKLTSACPRLQPNMLNKRTVHWCHHHALTSACPWLHQDMLNKHTGHQCHHHSLQLVHGYTRTCWTNTLVTSAIITHFSLSMATPGHVEQTHWSPVPSSLTSACPWLHQDMLNKHTGHQCHHHSLQLVHDMLHKHFSGNFGVVRVLLAVMHFDPWRPVPPQTAQLAVPARGGGSWLSGQDRSESFPDQKKIMLDVSVTSGVS